MSRVFIDRPIFAWVIAIIVMLVGAVSVFSLPIEQFPDIAPPQVFVNASYPGASAETLESSVTQVIEQQITGVDGLLYFSSSSSSQGQVQITATFAKGTNPDIAQVQVQNKVQQAISRLPQVVQTQGVSVFKSTPDQLLVAAIYDQTDQADGIEVTRHHVFLEQRGADQLRHGRHPQGVAVGCRLRCEFRADQTRGACPVVDDNLLAPDFGETSTEQARDDVRTGADGGGGHHTDRF